ncbi:MAG: hypothetical protein IJU83_00070 [Clostridia bacterium]|nr:hypothetical protein [Clostridia bacterium]
MKKYLDVCLLGATVLFCALTFALMAAAGVTGSLWGYTSSISVYDAMSHGDSTFGVILAFILMILTLLGAGFLLVVKLLNKKLGYEKFCGLVIAIIALVSGILYFLTNSFYGAGDLGAGAVFCGIFGLLEAAAMGVYTFKKFSSKK